MIGRIHTGAQSSRMLLAAMGISFLLASCGEGQPDPVTEASFPNIILLLADDLGYGDPGSYNPATKIPTPHIDRLAAEGMRFTDAHSPSAVCTPTRYGLLTGQYAWRTSLKRGVLLGYGPSLIDSTQTTLTSLLKQQGYATGGVGKWHLGLGSAERTDYSRPLRPGPTSFGFDYYYGIPASLDFEPYLYFENDRVVEAATSRTEGHLACCFGAFWREGAMAPSFKHDQVLPTFAAKAVAFIDAQAATPEQPFFLYVPFSAPHTPWLPIPPYVGTTEAGEYGDFTAQVDAVVGQILDAVDRIGQADNTLVIFTSDNGAIWTQEKIDAFDHQANLHWRGMKADIWEGGHRIPFVARWPGRIAAGTQSDQLLSLTDMLATFAAVVGVDLSAEAGSDSYDMLPALLGTADAPLRTSLISHSSQGVFALREGSWKLIEGRGSGGFTEPVRIEPGPGEPVGQLYNLAEDPGETNNRYLDNPEVVERLSALLDQYRQQGFSRPMGTTGSPQP